MISVTPSFANLQCLTINLLSSGADVIASLREILFKTTRALGYPYLTTPTRDTGTRDTLTRCLLTFTALSVESFCCPIPIVMIQRLYRPAFAPCTQEEWRLCEPSESRWCFGFNNSCWRLLLLRLGYGQDDYFQNETAIAESVFYQLYCTPCLEASSFQFGHDYEGAA